MNKTSAFCISAVLLALPASAKEQVETAADTVTAKTAFLEMPATTLDLLTKSMRLDMLDYLDQGEEHQEENTLEGLSWFNLPATRDYLQVQLTPVTQFTIRILPGRKTPVVATAYTVGDSLQAKDTQLRFFTPDMQEIKLDKIIKIASSEDFLDLKGVSRSERDRLLYLIPFPTVEYTFSPDGTDLKATLTVGEYLGREANETLQPYLRRVRIFRWDGKRYKLLPLDEKRPETDK